MLFQMGQNVIRNILNALFFVIRICNIDFMAFAVIRVIKLRSIKRWVSNIQYIDTAHIFNRKTKDITICNGFLNHVLVNTGIKLTRSKYISRCATISTFVFLENWCSSEANIVRIFEMTLNITVHFAELGAMALINNEYAFLLA